MTQSVPARNPLPKSKLEWALHLRDLGLQVFPLVHTDKAGNCSCGDSGCKPRNKGKHPRKGSQGFKDATTDADQIRHWWRDDPDANIGVWAGPERVWIDLDTKGEKSGLDTLAEFLKVDTFDLTDQTFAVRTPSGGIHLYFKTDVPVGDRVGVLPNVDIRGQGGYVVGPGSSIGEKTYEVITYRKIMPIPEGIQTVIRHVKERDSEAQVEMFELDLPESVSRAIEFLQRRPPAVEGQGGNEHTYVTSLQVRDLGISEEKCHELMLEHWNDRCDPPWDADELKVPIHNAFRYAKDRPGNKGGISAKFDDSEYFKDSGGPISAADLEAGDFPPPSYVVEGLVLENKVGGLWGDGGLGKTTLMEYMAVSVASGHPFFGRQVKQMPVLLVLSEDDYGITKQRLRMICEQWSLELDKLPIRLWCRVGEDNLIAMIEDNGGIHQRPFFDTLAETIGEGGQLVILDALTDFAELDESKRLAVNNLCKRVLGEFCQKLGCTLCFTLHPSKQSIADGTFYSGSTAWNNAIRLRLILEPKDNDGTRLALRTGKTNWGKKNIMNLCRRNDGSLILETEASIQDKSHLHKQWVMATAKELIERGINVVKSHGGGQKPSDLANQIFERYKVRLTNKDVLSYLGTLEREGKLIYVQSDKSVRGSRAGFKLSDKDPWEKDETEDANFDDGVINVDIPDGATIN